MKNLIDRKAVLKAMYDRALNCKKADVSKWAKLISTVETFPAAKPEWIDPAERMPGECVKVLGWVKVNPFSAFEQQIVYWNDHGWALAWNGRYISAIAGWMELPDEPEVIAE